MCLAVPAKVISTEGAMATVDMAGNRREVSLALLADAGVDDYVMVHAGFAIAKWAPEDAAVTLCLLEQLAKSDAETTDTDVGMC